MQSLLRAYKESGIKGGQLEIFGLLGLIALVATFLFQSAGFFDKRKPLFYILNAIGAAFLAYYAGLIQNIYFAILESIWCIAAFTSLGNILLKNHKNGTRKKVQPIEQWRIKNNLPHQNS